ncbi:hypothetical protein HNV10_13280 [Winogradskyella litoriviva]|uniref:DUF748 domain-containing protein n=1 Tax=Winogradskyella litoriviva TaxID=1220182 RepID=A0ABX2E738_9FLAO|nr:hypothetical protein [Winogradskyella litoriviva]NRD24225.1 hypothetical protein [Winogradskyella litoriviva]
MKQKYKKKGLIIAVVISVFVVLTIVANYVVENKLNRALNGLPRFIKLEYTSLRVNVIAGNLEINAPVVTINGKITQKAILNAQLKSIVIKNLSYWDYLINDEIIVEAIILDQLSLKYNYNRHVGKDEYNKRFLNDLKRIINVETIKMNKADIFVSNFDTDSTLLSIPEFNFELKKLQINPKTSKIENIIKYDDFNLNADNVKYAINQYDDLYIDSILLTCDNAVFKHFEIKTKYKRNKYSELLKEERDHFNLTIKEIKCKEINCGFRAYEKFYLTSQKVQIIYPEAEIYRDKLVANDTSYKSFYSTMLRKLDFELGLSEVEVSNGTIEYLEKVNKETPAGRLRFSNIEAKILNVGNINQLKPTEIKVNSLFMDTSVLKFNWSFKVADVTDKFEFKANLKRFNADQLDQFTKANLNVDFNGELKQTYFTIAGNNNVSRVDFKMKYDDFEVAILKKNGKEKNRFLSKLVNMIVSTNSEKQNNNFRFGQDKEVKRDVTKSIFNFVWLNVKQGLLTAMTGDGLLKKQ